MTWTKVSGAKSWRPEGEGEVLEGRYVAQQNRSGRNGDYTVYLVRDNEGAVWVLSGVILAKAFVTLDLRDRVRITFIGIRGQAPCQYRMFEVERWSGP